MTVRNDTSSGGDNNGPDDDDNDLKVFKDVIDKQIFIYAHSNIIDYLQFCYENGFNNQALHFISIENDLYSTIYTNCNNYYVEEFKTLYGALKYFIGK